MQTHSPSWLMMSSLASADIGYSALGSAIAFTTLAIVSVFVRWYTRAFLIRQVRVEDVLITLALILSMAMTGVVGAEVKLDTSIRIDNIKPASLSTMMKLVFAQSIFFHSSINLVKFAITLQYMVVFSSAPAIHRVCCLLLPLTTAALSWGIFGVIFLCSPVQKYWHPEMEGNCTDVKKHFRSSAILGIILDFALWLLPLPMIGKLQVPGRQKIGLLVVFGLGAFVCVVSVLRLVLVHDAAEKGNMIKSGSHAVIWSSIEVNVAIICASLLVMKPFFLRLFPSLMTQTESEGSGNRKETLSRNHWPGLPSTVTREHERYTGMSRKASGRPGTVNTENSDNTLIYNSQNS